MPATAPDTPSDPPGPPLVTEPLVPAIGRRLAAGMGRHRDPRAAIEARMMDRIADRPDLRAAIFRLVDVRPACRDYPDIAAHLAALLDDVEAPAAPFGLARSLARRTGSKTLVGVAGAAGVRAMAGRFIVGEDAADALPSVKKLWKGGTATSVDLLGEATVSETEADRYRDRCIATLQTLTEGMGQWPANLLLERDHHGAIPRVNLSVKVSALTPHLRADAPGRGAATAAPRLRAILRVARDLDAHVHVDMESLDHREAVRDLTLAILSEDEFTSGPSAGIVHQAYLTDAADELEVLLDWARAGAGAKRAQPLSIRLVKGAYWDHEVVEAEQAGWTVPVHTERRACDREFEALTDRLLDSTDVVRPLIASHNLRSVAHAIAGQRARGLDANAVEYQVLRGLGDPLAHALTLEGLRVRTYCPIGDLVAGMAYLVRRLLENTANDSFLRAHASGTDLDRLLEAP